MAYFYLEKYYKEGVKVDLFCKDPITCCKHVIRELYKERLPFVNIADGLKCEEITKKIRRYTALIKRLEGGEQLKFKKCEHCPVILVTLLEFELGRVEI